MTDVCPCCGASVRVDAWEAAIATLSPMQLRIARLVAKRPGVSPDDIADAIYANDQDGGPDDAVSTIRTVICYANKRLRPRGFEITAGRGCRNGYRVVAA